MGLYGDIGFALMIACVAANGGFDSGTPTWSPPNDFVNFQDIHVAVQQFQVSPTAPSAVAQLH